jgi:hypothetical protein
VVVQTPAPTKNRKRSKSASEYSPRTRVSCLRILCTISTRLPEIESPIQDNAESTISTPNLEQFNDSNSPNNPDPNALAGLDALLQVLQDANASNIVSTPSPDSLDVSRSPVQVSENAVQAAATALNQLSQQEASDAYYPFPGMILSVRTLSSERYILFSFCNLLCVASSVALGPRRRYPNSNASFPTRRSRRSYFLTTSKDLHLTGSFPSSIGHFSRTTIARSHLAY